MHKRRRARQKLTELADIGVLNQTSTSTSALTGQQTGNQLMIDYLSGVGTQVISSLVNGAFGVVPGGFGF